MSATVTSAKRALAWSFIERYAGLLTAVGSAMILSRLLTPAQVGVYSLCAAFTAVAGILRDFGVTEYIIQEKDLTRERLRAAYGLAFAVAWAIGAGIFLARFRAAGFYGEPQVADVLAILSLHFFLLPVSSPTFALLNRELAFRQLSVVQISSNIAQALATIAMAFAGWGVMSLAWGPIVNVAVQAAVLFWIRPRECLTLPAFSGATRVLKFGTMFVASRTIEVLARNFHEPVIAKQFGFASVGLFSRAFGLIDLFHHNVGGAILRVAAPAFAAQRRAGEDISQNYAKATAIFSCVSWSFFGFVALMSEPIIRVMFGAQWVQAAPLATALAISALPHGLFALAPQMLSATGYVSSRLKVSLFYAPLHIVFVLLAAQHTLAAIAWVWLLSNGLMLALYLWYLRRAVSVRLSVLLAPSLKSVVASGASALAQYLVLLAIQPLGLAPLVEILVVFTVGAAAWFTGVRFVSHPIYPEVVGLLRAVENRVRRSPRS